MRLRPNTRSRSLALFLTMSLVAAGVSLTVATPHASAVARSSETAGSARVGTTSYPAPASAVYAAPWGSDSSPGSKAAPVRTLAKAVALTPSSGTVVLRGGTYQEYLVLTKTVTIQSAPGEEVWLDGSSPVTGWVKDGSRWRRDGWTTRFDHSPTYTRGAPDSTNANWQFVNPTLAPMAGHPDQVWVGGVRQAQKKTLSQVGAGGFYLDEATSKLYVGSDPTGKEVRASVLQQALSARAPGVVLRGIGIRRYAPSVWQLAAVVMEKPDAVLENVVVSEMSTTGVSILAKNAQIRNVTVEWSGMLGFHNRFADNIVYNRVRASHNNAERFNVAPVSGGVKIGQTRGVTVTDSAFVDNFGHGFWTDMSVYNTVVSRTDFNRNSGDGLFLEISARAVVVDSMFLANKLDGIKVNNVSNVKIWNNTFIGNSRSLWLAQDGRRNTNRADPAVDPRVPFPDPEMPWELQDVDVSNNVIGLQGGTANCMLCVEDYSKRESGDAMRITANGNIYNRLSPSSPQWLAIWSRGAANPSVHTTLDSFRAATGREARGREFVGAAVVTPSGVLSSSVRSISDQVALPMPADVARHAGKAVGTRYLGAWVESGTVTPPPPPVTPPPPVKPPPPPTEPPPPLVTPTAAAGRDSFTRTVGSGWGSADLGGVWTIPAGANQFSTAGGGGRMRLVAGDGFEATLDGLRLTTTDITVATSADSVPDSVGHYNAVIGRSVGSNSDYRVKARTADDGSVTAWLVRRVNNVEIVLSSATHPSLQVPTGRALLIRLRVSGQGPSTLQAKMWVGGTAEPKAWWLSATDNTASLQHAGSPGLYAYSHGSASGQPVTIYWDSVEIRKD